MSVNMFTVSVFALGKFAIKVRNPSIFASISEEICVSMELIDAPMHN